MLETLNDSLQNETRNVKEYLKYISTLEFFSGIFWDPYKEPQMELSG